MKIIILGFLVLLSLFSCQEKGSPSSSSHQNIKSSATSSSIVKDEFTDLKKEDEKEGCSSEEDIEKALLKKQKAEDFKLGGDTDCTIQ